VRREVIKVDDDRAWTRPAERSRRDWTVVARQTEDYLREEFAFEATPQELAECDARHAALLSGPGPRRATRDAG
jgi:hypothetical protein